MEKLTKYNFDIKYRPGKMMEQADCLLRINHIEIKANDKQYHTNATYVLIVIYNDQGIWINERYTLSIKGKLQTSYRKVEKEGNLMNGSNQRTRKRNRDQKTYHRILGSI